MTITFAEASNALKNGTTLSWEKSGTFKAGEIQLETAAKRRLFNYLIAQDVDAVAAANESLFEGITEAWQDEEYDPADSSISTKDKTNSGPWRLKQISASGFGGLNTPDGPEFTLDVNCENWCLEGYNGSGKTSLTSLILWTMTGYRNREQDGPVKDSGVRQVVTNGTNKIGTWPPLVTYPLNAEQLSETANVSAQLIFEDPEGNLATAFRKIESPVDGDPIATVEIDERLLASPELIETGLLMPARIAHIGFGPKSRSLYDALKMLTGLDRLAAVAQGAGSFGHGAKRFLKYGKDNGIDGHARDFEKCLSVAKEESEHTSLVLSKEYKIDDEKLVEDLSAIKTEADEKAGAALTVLQSEIADTLDVNETGDRKRLIAAVSKARVYLDEGSKGIDLFKVLAALKTGKEEGFSDISDVIDEARASLKKALGWHAKQKRDTKLRLKALASKFFVSEDLVHEYFTCPLCESKLTSSKQITLAEELASLKSEAQFAERAIADACGDIEKSLRQTMPKPIALHFEELCTLDPRSDFTAAIKKRFGLDNPFRDILTGLASFATSFADSLLSTLPEFQHNPTSIQATEIAEVEMLQDLITDMERVSALTAWWKIHRKDFVKSWKRLIGKKDDDGNLPADSIGGKLGALEEAIASSEPLDKIASEIGDAITAVEAWTQVNQVQVIREAIAEALAPLKQLRQLVNCETHRTIITLQDKVSTILEEIQLKDRLSFENTSMNKKEVFVEASVAEGMKFDAALIANSSWLRALLWAFIFALRDQAVEESGSNSFPLMLLDDPQTTFDPKNKRKWAEKIVGMANRDASDAKGIQLILTTHERQFYDIICQTCELNGQEGQMARPSSSSKVAHIVNGTFLDRQFARAEKDHDEYEGYLYVRQVRTYCEDLLRIMLRPEAYENANDTLGKLCELLSTLNKDGVAPYNRRYFEKLLDLLSEKNQPIKKLINASNHTYDKTIGYAQALDVQKYWKNKLQKAFVNAFRLAADYDAYAGVTRLFAWEDNIIDFPSGHKDKIKEVGLKLTGVAAAAESDGLIGDGQIQIEQWNETKAIKLFAHNVYRLNAGTLSPVAGIGDVILVQDFPKPRPRNLTVTVWGDKLYARRLNETDDQPDILMLTAQAVDPYTLPDPVIVLKSKIKPRKIVGTLFLGSSAPPPLDDGQEVTAIKDFSLIASRLKNIELLKVEGRSMEPIALDGQHVMTVAETLDLQTLERLNGELVIAVDEDAGVYFKRLRLHDKCVVLESANSSATTSSEILSLDDSGSFKKLTSLKSVVGVLFDLPEMS